MSLKILIVEDRTLLAQDLADRISTLGLGEVVGIFSSGEAATEFADEHDFDVAILDISLKGEMDGITLAQILNEDEKTPIIYLTLLDDSSVVERALPTFPVAYLNKPISNSELKAALASAQQNLKSPAQDMPTADDDEVALLNDRIFVRNGRGKLKIPINEIVYFQSGGGEKSTIITEEYLDKKRKLPPSVGYSLSKLQPKINFYPHFVRCSRFHIVNLNFVDRITDIESDQQGKSKKCLSVKGEEIKVGEKYRKEVLRRLRIL